jgi:hypothetical protein
MLSKEISDTSYSGLEVTHSVVNWVAGDDLEAVVGRDEVDCIVALPAIRVLVVESG